MLCVDRRSTPFKDDFFSTFPTRLRENDVLVLNNTKVFPARLSGRTETGAKVELLLQEEIEAGFWMALAKPAKRLKAGTTLSFAGGLSCKVIHREEGSIMVWFDR